MKKILITGITGFAGSHLAELLLQDSDVEIFGTYVSEKNIHAIESLRQRIQLRKVELTNYEEVENLISEIMPDIIYHLAALPSPADSFKNPALYLQNNINAELYLLEAVKTHELLQTKILIISTSEVYGLVGQEDLPIDEDTPLRPVSPYGVSKIAQDFLGLQYHLAYNLSIVRVRPFGHIGPRLSEQFASSSFAKKIAEIEAGKREPILTVGNLDSRRDLTDVRDIVRAYKLLIEKGIVGDVYNLGSGISYKTGYILTTLLSYSKTPIEIKTDTSLFRPNDIPELRCDNRKIKELTGWEPTVSLETSLQDTLDYWRKVI